MEPGLDDGSPRQGRSSDAEDALSDYSSCEGSEFERYCSANSAFGSASRCSSIGSYSELSDSFKSHTENRSIREKFWRSRWNYLPDEGLESPRANGCSQNPVRMDLLPRTRTGSELFLSSDENPSSCKGDSSAREAIGANGNDGLYSDERVDLDENSGPAFNGFASDYNVRSGMMPEEDGDALSWCECSEGEDSMLDYGTDNECRIHSYGANNFQHGKQTKPGNENENPLLIKSSVAFGSDDWDGFMEENRGDGFTSLSLYQVQPVQHQPEPSEIESLDHVNVRFLDGMEQEEDIRDIPAASCQVEDIDLSTNSVRDCAVRNPLGDHEVTNTQKPLAEQCSQEDDINFEYDGPEREIQSLYTDGLTQTPLRDSPALQFHSTLTEASQGEEVRTQEFDRASSFLPMDKNGSDSIIQRVAEGNSNSTDVFEEDIVLGEVRKLDTYDSYDEMVLEMEEILLDSGKSHGARFTQANQAYITQQSRHFRDGSSTASTSGTDDAYLLVQYPPKIDWIEVVGAKQKKGDVSFGERLVGVREYTVYILRVWSGRDKWEVERRYRDFDALYHQLKTLFTEHGLSLPSSWSYVERESRKIFGNVSPIVISERSTLIQNCLRSILNSTYPFGTPNSLVCFLSPSKSMQSSGWLKALVPQSLQKFGEDEKSKFSNFEETSPEDISLFGKTISLVVEMKLRKSTIQLLDAQHYRCAGCHRHLDAEKTLLREIIQTLGWNKPRFCEYTGQLFCASCHTNDTAVLPARVLHLWDFSLYPVSQLAKAYLESIYDQPMLCVSAVNPFLFSKVPMLLHVVGVRKKIGAMLPYVRCPFRRSIQRGLGLRRHLESNDFFALRDLVDLSKGAFAALPVMLETISNKISEHITQQCLECYDAGVPCAARQACDDPSSLIFPFQEAEATRCGSCGSIFHKPCFGKLMGCPCGKPTSATTEQVSQGASKELNQVLHRSIQRPDSSPTLGFLSDILSKARPDKIWKPKNRAPVILMGSLPSTSL